MKSARSHMKAAVAILIVLAELSGCRQPGAPIAGENQAAPNHSARKSGVLELRWTAAEIKWLREQLHSGIAIEVQNALYAKLDALGDKRLPPQEAIELLEPLHEKRIAEPEWNWVVDMLHGQKFRPCPVPDGQGHWILVSGQLPPWLAVINKHEIPANSP